MVITENECVDCQLPCIYEGCPYFAVTRYYCDNCKEEEPLYEYDGYELCIECIKKELRFVGGI